MRILVCGDRDWTDKSIIYSILAGYADYDDLVIIEGEARGADSIAGEWARDGGVDLMPFPAKWDEFGKAAGPIRNQQMLDEGKPELVVAFHNNLEESKGTKDMVERAVKAGVPVYHVRRVS